MTHTDKVRLNHHIIIRTAQILTSLHSEPTGPPPLTHIKNAAKLIRVLLIIEVLRLRRGVVSNDPKTEL